MKSSRVALALSLVTAVILGVAQAEEPVHFPDEVLRAAVEDKLGVFEPTPQDMLDLTSLSHVMSFSSQDQGIADLSGLEYAINLRNLNLRLNRIDDLSPLSGLIQLETLNLSQNAIDSLSALSDLVNLVDLNVHANLIDDVSVLSDFTDLYDLDLHTNLITDISPLSDLVALEWLDLFENQITDISPLDGLRNLISLDLRSNDTLSEDAYCEGFQAIMNMNPGLDLSYTTRLHTPTGISASKGGYPNVVRIRWDAVCNGPDVTSHYRVSRTTSTQEAKAAISAWQTSAHFDDTTAQNGTAYYYWIQMALNEDGGSASDYAEPEQGWASRPLITLSSSVGGSIRTPTPYTRILRGETIPIHAEPVDANLFVFASWTGSAVDQGKVVDRTNPYTSLMADDYYSLKANFLARTGTLIVDDDGPEDPGPGDAALSDPQESGTVGHPFDSIQEAIRVVHQGATIWVEPGIYYESINLMGKNIRLTGIGSNDAETHPYPVIDAMAGGTAVTFDHGEDARCQMSGFIITGGYGSQAGAIACINASPTVTNCLIVGNRSEDPLGGAVYCVNSYGYFGNCTISGNYCGEQGAAVHLIDSGVSFERSLIVANAPFNVLHWGSSASSGEFRFIDDSEEHCPLFRLPGFWAESSDGIAVSDGAQPGAIWIHGDYRLAPDVVRWDGEGLSWVLDDVTGPCLSPVDPGERVFQMGAYGDPSATR